MAGREAITSEAPHSGRQPAKRNRALVTLRAAAPGAGLVVVVILGVILSPTFLTLSNLQNIMISAAILGVLALGQTLVMLVREIDLSMGSLMAFGPIAAVWLTERLLGLSGTAVIVGGNYVVAGMALIIVLTLVISGLVGLLNGVITVKGKVPSLVVTLGMLYVLRGTAYVLSGGTPLYFTNLEGFDWLGNAKAFGVIPVSFLIFLLLGVAAIIILKFTKVGPRIYSTGGNEKAAVYSGVKVSRWVLIAFIFAGSCSGISALFYVSRLVSVEAAQATGYELTSIAVAVIGGTTLAGGRGTMLGTMLATLTLAVVINIVNLQGLVIWYQTIIIGLIIIAAVLAYSGKLRFGRARS
jgi:ribose/xylose/arabinose/galactoside ABC-type transport system permease subunit